MSHVAPESTVRERLAVRGRVQGVGFRPFVFRLASELHLAGLVGNDSHGAFIEIQGPADRIETFKHRLVSELPPLARITELHAERLSAQPALTDFHIQTSANDGTQDAEITPDMAMCADCRRELFDPNDRRYRYPFINCTNCGPRYSIIRSVPYDRPGTTMAKFTMCPACQAEYDDPANRRFHAQPNACPVCGPRVWVEKTTLEPGDAATRREEEDEVGGDAIVACARLIRQGQIVAIKGLGGFHLCCRADDDEVVRRLRERKARESKPLALMVADLEAARALAHISEAATTALTDVTRPIVLVPRRPDAPVSRHVAPGTDMLGIMLPYTPLHELLFAEGLGPLVMTSGNPTEEPLCCENDEARSRLAHIADAILLHDRDIERRVDDSVVMVAGEEETTRRRGNAETRRDMGDKSEDGESDIVPIRRARGFAPAPIGVPMDAAEPVLAVGAELKSTVCVLTGNTAIVSEHLGELANAKAYRNFVATVEQFKHLLRVEPRIIACDLHPEYSSTRYARAYAAEHGLQLVAVQHHHAHMVSVMAENGLTGPVLGISCDGTGFGTDGAIWGCELLVGDEARFERAGHLQYFPLLGGDTAAHETWRPAAGLLHACFGANWIEHAGPAFASVSAEAVSMAKARLGAGRLPLTSSLGRLFDAVALLLRLCGENRHEAEAAMALEAAARTVDDTEPLAFELQTCQDGPDGSGRHLELGVRSMLREILAGVAAGRDRAELARAFHETIAAGLAEAAKRIARERGLERVVLSGGCFANRLLLASLTRRLRHASFDVYVHRLVPTGDGGVSLGQAVCAA